MKKPRQPRTSSSSTRSKRRPRSASTPGRSAFELEWLGDGVLAGRGGAKASLNLYDVATRKKTTLPLKNGAGFVGIPTLTCGPLPGQSVPARDGAQPQPQRWLRPPRGSGRFCPRLPPHPLRPLPPAACRPCIPCIPICALATNFTRVCKTQKGRLALLRRSTIVLMVGSVIAHYRLLKQVGSGGMGAVLGDG